MAKRPATRSTTDEGPPTQYPETPPPRGAQHGHDFTLQAVIEMQRSIGELCAKVDRLIDDAKGQARKLEELRDEVRKWAAWVAAGVAVIAVVGTALGFATRFVSFSLATSTPPPATAVVTNPVATPPPPSR
jgi:phage-related minor tail protein